MPSGANMKISPEAKKYLIAFLEDAEDSFVRVGQLTVGGGCCASILLGVTIDDEFNAQDDLTMEVEGLPVVIDKALYARLTDISVEADPEQGIVVKHA